MNDHSETIIQLTDIDPIELFGPADLYLNHINAKFPQVKVVTRGLRIKVSGSQRQVERYADRLEALKAYYKKYGHLSVEVIDRIYDSVAVARGGELRQRDEYRAEETHQVSEADDVIVYGNGGSMVRARTKHQIKLVEEYSKCDLLFAIGGLRAAARLTHLLRWLFVHCATKRSSALF